MKNDFVKGLIMAIIALIASYISDNIEVGINWAYLTISTIGVTVVYIAKNAWYKSDSPAWWLNYKDLFSGLLLAIGTAISSGVASFITDGKIAWAVLGKTVLFVVIGYFSKTFVTNQGKIVKK